MLLVSCSSPNVEPNVENNNSNNNPPPPSIVSSEKKTSFELTQGDKFQSLDIFWINDTTIRAEIQNKKNKYVSNLKNTLSDKNLHGDMETWDDAQGDAQGVREFVYADEKSKSYYDIKVAFDTSFAVILALDPVNDTMGVTLSQLMQRKK